MPITIRPAEERDISVMAKLRAEEWGDKTFWTDRITRYMRGEHSPQQAFPERGIFVGVDQETMVGFVAGHRTRRFDCDGELQWINVAPRRRGQGIAEMLMARIAEWLCEQDAKRICVNVAPRNTTARRLYARCGARPLGPQWMVWDDIRLMKVGEAKGRRSKTNY